ncbi:hypothetical protein DAEQUDRAFT_511825 [Daedalea quercina L-15889]|uniref:Uncharacterized protein n=1 Tax=Daedalea quercina L-15889 TaxID=1314783 RepID=A0A165TBI6_9APHY|nr:hypothetical protein DAEQUDRAFT_511825 [Daedalea quercina L-15889]
MQELLLNALLAYRMGRTFVYYNYTWRDDGSQYTLFNDKHVPSTIPLSALLQGPVLGAPPTTDRAAPQPFAVTEDHFHRVCPPGARTVVRADAVTALAGAPTTAAGVLAKWVERFGALPDKCLEVPRDGGQNFDIYMFGDASRLLDVWPVLSQSPLLREFAWSPLVERAFDRNRAAFAPAAAPAVRPLTGPGSSSGARPGRAKSPSAARYAPLAGLLALHVRRGDFAEHCADLARWGSSYVANNAFPGMPDTFRFPPGADADADARVEMQRPHCFPSIPEIVARAVEERERERARGDGGGAVGLVDVYVMTNGPGEWVRELKDALWTAGGWRSVASSRDLELDWEQRFVKQAVDMLIGQRAQVFVGNGFSSLSGLVNMLRTANGIPAAQNRLF